MNSKKVIIKLLNPGAGKGKMYGSWLALCFGMLLLFIAVLAWIDFNEMLAGKDQKDTMSEYLVIGKVINDKNTGRNKKENLFTEAEMQDLRKAQGVQELGSLTANLYPVSATLGGSLGFSTELFLESVEDRFLDVQPENWQWQDGQQYIPIIVSNDFLNLYNYGFALSQGYPQLSQKSIRNIPFQLNIAGREQYRAQIVGFTDRISSVLVPQVFMKAMNERYGRENSAQPSRLILKVQDPSEKKFVQYLEQHQYTVNQEQLRWSRIRTVVQAVVSSVGIVAIVVVGMAVLSFILFVEVTVQKSHHHIKLMLQLGYAPAKVKAIIFRYFMPWLGSAVIFASIVAIVIHWFMIHWLATMDLNIEFSSVWPLGILMLMVLAILTMLLSRSVRQVLKKI